MDNNLGVLSKSERKSVLCGGIAAGIAFFLIVFSFDFIFPLLYSEKSYNSIEIINLSPISEEEVQTLEQAAVARMEEKKVSGRGAVVAAAKKKPAQKKKKARELPKEAVAVAIVPPVEEGSKADSAPSPEKEAESNDSASFYDQFAPNFLPYDSTAAAEEKKSEILKAMEIRLAEEDAKRMEELKKEQERIEAEREKVEQARREEKARLDEIARRIEERRRAEEKRLADAKAAAEAKKAAEAKRIAE